jgi:hypothetical protein
MRIVQMGLKSKKLDEVMALNSSYLPVLEFTGRMEVKYSGII